MRRALSAVEGVAPAILWIDELEKGLSGVSGGDGGVASRVFGNSLTWMEDVVLSALFEAFAERTPKQKPRLTSRHLLKAAGQLVPLSRTRRHQIEDLRTWAAKNCRPANRALEPTAGALVEPAAGESLVEKQARMLDLG